MQDQGRIKDGKFSIQTEHLALIAATSRGTASLRRWNWNQDQAETHELIEINIGTHRVFISNFGARLLSWQGADGINVVLAPSDEKSLREDTAAMGASIGRVCNRIAHGRFTIPGQGLYQLPLNNGEHHIHGGPLGFQSRLWSFVESPLDENPHAISCQLSLHSAAGDQGYPGEVDVLVQYRLTSGGVLDISYQAKVAGASCPLNFTHHAYWNLSGADSGATIQDHYFSTVCSRFLPTDASNIPSGEICSVHGSVNDFRQEKRIDLDWPTATVSGARDGYDVFFLRDAAKPEIRNLPLQEIARLYHAPSGRSLRMSSDQLGFQFYTGNYLSTPFKAHQGVCLEPSALIDAVNHPKFGSILVHPGQSLCQNIRFELGLALSN
ncbi:MAG: galactose mutarotase [Proteobacteria bacterium]|nr:galactose mutarotase [Pseudomonadota bacterium]